MRRATYLGLFLLLSLTIGRVVFPDEAHAQDSMSDFRDEGVYTYRRRYGRPVPSRWSPERDKRCWDERRERYVQCRNLRKESYKKSWDYRDDCWDMFSSREKRCNDLSGGVNR